ncbi:8077_t:CDS:2 [Gigaspora rosea]|nr:8077_t:CDS:2 [Gigaspora rosea]
MPDPIWVHFTQLGHVAGYKQKKRKCNYCQQQINDALRAARTHFRNCNVASLDQKKIYFGNSYEEEDNNDISVESESALVASSSSPTSLVPSTLSNENALTRNTSRSRITNYIILDRISKEEQKLLKLEFAQSTFQCGLFLSLPEMEPIKKLIYDETKKNVKTLIKNGKNLCLVSDGWSNLFQEHWTNYILTTPKPIFYTAHPTNEVRQNSEAITNDLEKIIIEVGISKVSAIITDNASVMKKA